MNTAQEIHNEFRQALDTSTIKVNEVPDTSTESQIVERLSKFGLAGTTTYRNAATKLGHVSQALKHNEIISSIRRVETTYPDYRLIGINKVKEICLKYGLLLTELDNYVGSIPNKNLIEIERHAKAIGLSRSKMVRMGKPSIYQLFKQLESSPPYADTPQYYICAPKKDLVKWLTVIDGFVATRVEGPKFKLEFNTPEFTVVDPIVLTPCNIDGQLIMQIVTAWGPEADDDYVTSGVKRASSDN